MSRSVVSAGLSLIALALGVFAWKTLALGLPVAPAEPAGLWQVELQLAVRGRGETGSVRTPLPTDGPGQRVFGAWSSAGGLEFSRRSVGDLRLGVWSGWMEDLHRIAYVFSVERFPVGPFELEGDPGRPPDDLLRRYTRPTADVPATAQAIRRAVGQLALPGPEDRAGRVRSLYAYLRHEITRVPDGTDDAILALTQRGGSERGCSRLLVALLRAVGIPARVASGLELREGRARPRSWAEVWWQGEWILLAPHEGLFGEPPLHWIALAHEDVPLVESSGVRSVSFAARSLRQHLTPSEVGAVMLPADPVFSRLSFYRLSVSTQAALRILLLLPVAALVVALLRNVVGLPSYGTFMPVLIAMALRGTGLGLGLLMVGLVLAIGVCGRLLVDRLRLLLVPRLSILLSIVILCVAGLALVGRSLDERDFYAGIVFPIVILAMLVERFSVVMAEEGLPEALGRAGWSMVIAIVVYPLFRSTTLEHVMFGFPELVLAVIGLLVLLGGYTGYRVSDWLRFRQLPGPDLGARS